MQQLIKFEPIELYSLSFEYLHGGWFDLICPSLSDEVLLLRGEVVHEDVEGVHTGDFSSLHLLGDQLVEVVEVLVNLLPVTADVLHVDQGLEGTAQIQLH